MSAYFNYRGQTGVFRFVTSACVVFLPDISYKTEVGRSIKFVFYGPVNIRSYGDMTSVLSLTKIGSPGLNQQHG